MRRGSRVGVLLAGLICLAMSGCSMQRVFTYPLGPIETVSGTPLPVKIAVLPAKDFRRSENTSATLFLGFIPGFPFGWMTYERPEAADHFVTIRQFDFKATEDVPKAIAQHIEQSGYAKTAFFDFGGNVSQADYVLESELHSTRYSGSLYTYGISYLAAYLWLFALPAGSSTVDLWVDLRLKDRHDNVVWAHSIKASEDHIQGLYYNYGRDMEPLARSLQVGLDQALRRNPLPGR